MTVAMDSEVHRPSADDRQTASPMPEVSRAWLRFDLGRVVALVVALVGILIGAQRISDNSFLTHLATGREIIAHGFVHHDVFTWTSQGRDVVVQSWLASLLYGVVDDLAGFGGLRVLTGFLAGALAWLVWNLGDQNPSVHTRVLVTAPILVIGAGMWSGRPLLIALVMLAVTLRTAQGRGSVRHLAVVGFVWIGVHGSWPLGMVLLTARIAGARMDHSDFRRESKALAWLGAGILLGGVANPYGPRLLIFPIQLLGRREVLSHVVEWQSPSFDALYARAFLLVIVVTIIAVTRRSTWRSLLPAIIFIAAALVSRRNIPIAAVVAIPVMAEGLPSLGRLKVGESSAVIHRLGTMLLAAVLVLPIVGVRSPNVDLSKYPVEAIDVLENAGMSPADTHLIHPDFVGNYLDLRYGDEGSAWIDDRYELHEASLMADYLVLFDAGPSWREVLDRTGGVTLVWQTDRALTQLVSEIAGWKTIWADDEWTALCDPASTACADFRPTS